MSLRHHLLPLIPCLVLGAACGKKVEPEPAKPTTAPTAPTAPAEPTKAAEADAVAEPTKAAEADVAEPTKAPEAATETKAVEADAGATAPAPEAPAPVFDTAGFATPESVLVAGKGEYYLVANINGAPLDKDDNGFISKLGPDGAIVELKWIDGAKDEIELHAPKGMGLSGNTLWVADVDTVRAFDATTGAPTGATPVAGATFLNDVYAHGEGGWIYVTDSAIGPDFKPKGTPGVWRFREQKGEEAATMLPFEDVGLPNGVFAIAAGDAGDTVYLNGFDDTKVVRVWKAGEAKPATVAIPAGQLDGLVGRTVEGTTLWYTSSWETGAVYEINDKGESRTIVSGLKGPADFAIDEARGVVVVPVFMENRVVAYKL